MKANIKNIVFSLLLIICIILGAVIWTNAARQEEALVWSDVVSILYTDADTVNPNVSAVIIDDDKVVTITVRDAEGKETYRTYQLSSNEQREFLYEYERRCREQGVSVRFDEEAVKATPWYITWLPYLIVMAIIIVFFVYMMRQASGRGGKMNSFARAHAKTSASEKNPVKFTDVAGAEEEKEELREVVEFLRDPQKFIRLGARIPRGVLLVGPPGTGKTLLARAVAGEAGVPFYSISGSDFVEMYVGVGASRVRDLFDTARKSPASIIFIDEIDAGGRHRGAGLGGGHDEREQTLNQLLVEMDGFGNHEGVIVIAATNRPDILDPALLRPGRFDRQVTVNYPDLNGRVDILRVHVRNKPLEANVDLKKVAQATVGFTGADLANLMNEAALLAARRGKSLIGMEEIEAATLKVMVGTEKKNMKITPEEKKKTAYHEAGHAILAHLFPSQDPVRRISIIPSGRALGYTLNPPAKDKYSVYKSELKEQISMLLGGRAAEFIIYGDVSGGASNDIQRASQIARNMVMKLGMSDAVGNIQYGSEHDSDEVFLGRDFNTTVNYSEETAALIDSEVKRIVDEAYDTAIRLLKENIDKLHFVAGFLVKYEVMDEEQFAAAMNGATEEELVAISEERAKRSAEENSRAAEAESAFERSLEQEREQLMREALGGDDAGAQHTDPDGTPSLPEAPQSSDGASESDDSDSSDKTE